MDREDMAGALGRGTKKIQPMLDIVESLSSHEEHLVLAKEGDLIMSDEHLERLLDRSVRSLLLTCTADDSRTQRCTARCRSRRR